MLSMGGCFGCGDFVDYTSGCRYNSKVKVIVDNRERGLCKREDIPLEYAIKLGILEGKHKTLEKALEEEEKKRLKKFGMKMKK
jgi:hypothetical protein